MNYWFVKTTNTEFQVIADGTSIGRYNMEEDSLGRAECASIAIPEDVESAVRVAFYEFVRNDVYYMGAVDDVTAENAREVFCKMLHGALVERERRLSKYTLTDDSEADKKFNQLVSWLDKAEFFTGPASSMYHEAFVGGLCYHSVKVALKIKDLVLNCESFKFKIPLDSAILVALLHDVCKAGYYEAYKRNVKNDETGKWESVDAFRRKQDNIPNYDLLGHGASSEFIISRFLPITTAEALAIRWHMGFTEHDHIGQVGQAFEMFPLAFALSTADMDATYYIEGRP